MDDKTKILFIATDFGSFIDNDYNILRKHFLVKRIDTWIWRRNIRKFRNIFSTMFNLCYLIWSMIRSDIIFIWFANIEVDRLIKISRIFHKKTIVVIGGGEVADEPEIQYGRLISPENRNRINYILKNADGIIAVSDFTKNEIEKINPHVKIHMLHNCIDVDIFRPSGNKEKKVITAGYICDDLHITLKGLDTFCSTARLLPEISFTIIGADEKIHKKLKKISPPNVKFIPPISQQEIVPHFQQAKVYCQLSYRESFGMALVEAMACECIPVVSLRGALPEIVGDSGYLVPYHDPKKTAEAIRLALISEQGPVIRKMVEEKFSIFKKEVYMIALIKSIVKN